jgi:hypothetical protein
MYDKLIGVWRCGSCGYDNDPDLPACVYCGEPCHTAAFSFDELPLLDEEEEEQ